MPISKDLPRWIIFGVYRPREGTRTSGVDVTRVAFPLVLSMTWMFERRCNRLLSGSLTRAGQFSMRRLCSIRLIVDDLGGRSTGRSETLLTFYFQQLTFCWKTLAICKQCLLLAVVLPALSLLLLREENSGFLVLAERFYQLDDSACFGRKSNLEMSLNDDQFDLRQN